MKTRTWAAAVLLALATLRSTPALAEFTPLKEGDRVVFYGDSITEQRLYTRYLQQYVDVRYPDRNIRFFNAGWGGDTAPGGLRRLERDVLVLNPTVVTLFFGMNDGHYRAFEQSTADEYRAGMEGIIKTLKDHNVRVIIYTPGAVDYDSPAPRGRDDLRRADYNGTLNKLGDVCRQLGQQYGCEVVDVQKPMIEFQNARKAQEPGFTMIPDAIHPNPAGHLVMMKAMIPALAEPMGPLATVDANAASNADGTIQVQHEGGTWRITTQTTTPFWIENGSLNVAQQAGVNEYVFPKLIIKNLPAGKYEVEANGANPDVVTEAQLAQGVPVVLNNANGQLLHELIRQKEDAYRFAWREIRLPLGGHEHVDAAVNALKTVDDELSAAIHETVAAKQAVTIVVRRAPTGPNYALHKPYETSDPNTHNWGIGGLTDGSWEASPAHCFASNEADQFPKTATVDLQQAVSLGQVTIGVPEFGSTKTVVVSLSEDGRTFHDVGQHEFSLRQSGRTTLTFAPTTARYVRLTYPDHFADTVGGYTPTFVFTTEVEAYGPQQNQ